MVTVVVTRGSSTITPLPTEDAALAELLAKPTTGTPTSVSASASAVSLIAANTSRKGGSVYYDGAAVLYLILSSTTPTSSLYSAKMGDGYLTYFEIPSGYTGAVKGIWSSAVGSALVTEYA